MEKLPITIYSCTSPCPSPAGTMTSSSPERPCFSSGRKNGLTNGASATTSHAEKFSPSTKSGNFPNSGTTTACHWSIMDEALSKSQRFSGKLDKSRRFGLCNLRPDMSHQRHSYPYPSRGQRSSLINSSRRHVRSFTTLKIFKQAGLMSKF